MARRVAGISATAAVLLALTACSSTTDGRPAKSDVPARAYDVRLFMCPNDSFSGDRCDSPATAAQIAAVWNRLQDDDAVRNVLYLSPPRAYRVARQVLSKQEVDLVGPNGLPATFLLELTEPDTQGPFVVDRYRTMNGVYRLTPCTTGELCSVRTLRAAGVLH